MKRSSERVNLYQLHQLMWLNPRGGEWRDGLRSYPISRAWCFFYQLPRNGQQRVRLTGNFAPEFPSVFLRCSIRRRYHLQMSRGIARKSSFRIFKQGFKAFLITHKTNNWLQFKETYAIRTSSLRSKIKCRCAFEAKKNLRIVKTLDVEV